MYFERILDNNTLWAVKYDGEQELLILTDLRNV